MNEHFWIGFEKRAFDTALDRTEREISAIREEIEKNDVSNETEKVRKLNAKKHQV